MIFALGEISCRLRMKTTRRPRKRHYIRPDLRMIAASIVRWMLIYKIARFSSDQFNRGLQVTEHRANIFTTLRVVRACAVSITHSVSKWFFTRSKHLCASRENSKCASANNWTACVRKYQTVYLRTFRWVVIGFI